MWKIYFVNYDLVFQHWMISAKLGVVKHQGIVHERFHNQKADHAEALCGHQRLSKKCQVLKEKKLQNKDYL